MAGVVPTCLLHSLKGSAFGSVLWVAFLWGYLSACSEISGYGPGHGSGVGGFQESASGSQKSRDSILNTKAPQITDGHSKAGQLVENDSSSASISFEKPPSLSSLASGASKPPKPEDVGEKLAEAGDRWFFGPGLGRTALNIGTIVVFPPYCLYLLGNAGLQLFGYDGLYVTDALPKNVREPVISVYDGVTSVPGEFNSLVFDKRFHREDLYGEDPLVKASEKATEKKTSLSKSHQAPLRYNKNISKEIGADNSAQKNIIAQRDLIDE